MLGMIWQLEKAKIESQGEEALQERSWNRV
jgi:hypothetical protein